MRIKGELDERLFRELTRAKIRSTNAIAEKNEIKNKILSGEYIRREDASKIYADKVLKVKQKFLGLAANIAPRCEKITASEAYEIISNGVLEILKDLAASEE